MSRRSLTLVTPGAAQAACTAESCSAQERTVPVRTAVPFTVSTSMFSASSLASRFIAFLIESLTSPAYGVEPVRYTSFSTDQSSDDTDRSRHDDHAEQIRQAPRQRGLSVRMPARIEPAPPDHGHRHGPAHR